VTGVLAPEGVEFALDALAVVIEAPKLAPLLLVQPALAEKASGEAD